MIQLSYTKDWHTPQAIWFDLLSDPKPIEYHHHFYDYQYLTEGDAEQMLNDPYVTQSVKDILQKTLLDKISPSSI